MQQEADSLAARLTAAEASAEAAAAAAQQELAAAQVVCLVPGIPRLQSVPLIHVLQRHIMLWPCASSGYRLVQESARQQLADAMEAEGRRLAEAHRSVEALTAAAGADKESTVAALQARTAEPARKRVSTLNILVPLSKRTVDWHRSQHAGLIQRARASASLQRQHITSCCTKRLLGTCKRWQGRFQVVLARAGSQPACPAGGGGAGPAGGASACC
jgi:hypothetical protein